jgi:hypothetical protein
MNPYTCIGKPTVVGKFNFWRALENKFPNDFVIRKFIFLCPFWLKIQKLASSLPKFSKKIVIL